MCYRELGREGCVLAIAFSNKNIILVSLKQLSFCIKIGNGLDSFLFVYLRNTKQHTFVLIKAGFCQKSLGSKSLFKHRIKRLQCQSMEPRETCKSSSSTKEA